MHNDKPLNNQSSKPKEKIRIKSTENNMVNTATLTNNLMNPSKIGGLILHYSSLSFITNNFYDKPCKLWKSPAFSRKRKRKSMQFQIEKSMKNDDHQRPYCDYIPIVARIIYNIILVSART